MGKQLTGAAHAGLHFVENQKQVIVVAELTQCPKEGMRCRAHTALALQRLDQDARGLRADRFFDGFKIAEREPDRNRPSAGRNLRDI